jgi:hypothetical protein
VSFPHLRGRVAAGLVAIAIIAVGLLPAAAGANTPIESYIAVPSTTQAGGHPDLEVRFSLLNRFGQGSKSACNCEDAKDAITHLPTGFIGNPHAAPQCSIADFSADSCPIDSQVGIVYIDASLDITFVSPVYNLVPPPNDAGLLGFKIFFYDTPQFEVFSGRTASDYGLDSGATSIFHGGNPVKVFQQVIWGVPADPSHDALRINPANVPGTSYFGNLCDANGAMSTADPSTVVKICTSSVYPDPPSSSNSPLAPFLQNPTTCDTPLSSSLDVLSYDGGTTHAESSWPQMTGCDQLSFNPSLYAQPTTNETDTASGIDVNLQVPQQLSPTVPSPSELKGATVTLPAGFSINPNAADGKTSCSDAQANFGTTLAANCPEFSKIGSLEIDSSALPGPLPGFIYLGQPLPGNRYRIFLVADGFATHIKLAGTITPDPLTGQLVTTFTNLPQSPLTAFDMHFFGSERGLLATPTQCGTYPVTSTFTPWDSSLGTQTSSQFFTLDSGPNGSPCPGSERPFGPTLQAASRGNTAGAHTSFSLQVARPDGDQNLTGLTVTTPPGFSATLAGIPYCPDIALAAAARPTYSGLAEQSNPSCPAASQIGTAVTGAGAGTHPIYVDGKVYLAGPYHGAPLSLAVITPALSGPYDLGNVVVRAAIRVNPATAQITTVSDPLPQILQGIPLRLRSILINLDRPNFALNPTNCDPFSVNATLAGDQGAVANLSSPFQVANCAALAFNPALSLKLSGSTKRAGNPALKATLTYPQGGSYANIASTTVALPPTEQIDNAHIRDPCTKVQFNLGNALGEKCPAGSVIGFARTDTPLLASPLEGPVYFRSAPENKSGLPDIVAVLRGQIEITLDGKIKTVFQKLPNGEKVPRITTTFGAVPDAPVSKFTLSLDGAQKGLLQNNTNLCKSSSLRVNVKMAGQNGKALEENPLLGTPCGKSAKHKRKADKSRRAGR